MPATSGYVSTSKSGVVAPLEASRRTRSVAGSFIYPSAGLASSAIDEATYLAHPIDIGETLRMVPPNSIATPLVFNCFDRGFGDKR